MCLIGLRWQPGAAWPLLGAFNRDEYRHRAAAPAEWWPQGLLAGRDLESGGTWLGVTRASRFAAVTNYRDPSAPRKGALSRGRLPVEFLSSGVEPRTYLDQVRRERAEYAGFNLLVGTPDELWWYGSHPDRLELLKAGAYSLSNADLDSPWPKARRLLAVMRSAEADDEILEALCDRGLAPDAELPDTGVGLAMERALSAAFIDVPSLDYGTRCSTVLRLGREHGRFTEWTWPSSERRDFTW
jgi:uncharacterized protein with NRDE domain